MVENSKDKSTTCGRILAGIEKFEFDRLKAHCQVEDYFNYLNSLKFSWDNRRRDGPRVLARLDRFYAFPSPDSNRSSHILNYDILGNCSLSVHLPIRLVIRLHDSKNPGGHYKMNGAYLKDASIVQQSFIYRAWREAPPHLEIFGKMRRVVKLYKSFSKDKAAKYREQESILRTQLETGQAAMQALPTQTDSSTTMLTASHNDLAMQNGGTQGQLIPSARATAEPPAGIWLRPADPGPFNWTGNQGQAPTNAGSGVGQLVDQGPRPFNRDPASQSIRDSALQLQNKVDSLLKELSEFEKRKIEGQQVRSRIRWRNARDKGTKDFYRVTRERPKENCIIGLEEDSGVIRHSQEELETICYHFYSNLYNERDHSDNHDTSRNWAFRDFHSNISASMRESLNKPMALAELTIAIESMTKDKATGPDGILTEFYLCLWPCIGLDFLSMIQNSTERGRFPNGVTEGLIALIHKGGSRFPLNNWRPITLLNVAYNIFAKAL